MGSCLIDHHWLWMLYWPISAVWCVGPFCPVSAIWVTLVLELHYKDICRHLFHRSLTVPFLGRLGFDLRDPKFSQNYTIVCFFPFFGNCIHPGCTLGAKRNEDIWTFRIDGLLAWTIHLPYGRVDPLLLVSAIPLHYGGCYRGSYCLITQ